jgi:hypothetical protein
MKKEEKDRERTTSTTTTTRERKKFLRRRPPPSSIAREHCPSWSCTEQARTLPPALMKPLSEHTCGKKRRRSHEIILYVRLTVKIFDGSKNKNSRTHHLVTSFPTIKSNDTNHVDAPVSRADKNLVAVSLVLPSFLPFPSVCKEIFKKPKVTDIKTNK